MIKDKVIVDIYSVGDMLHRITTAQKLKNVHMAEEDEGSGASSIFINLAKKYNCNYIWGSWRICLQDSPKMKQILRIEDNVRRWIAKTAAIIEEYVS